MYVHECMYMYVCMYEQGLICFYVQILHENGNFFYSYKNLYSITDVKYNTGLAVASQDY